MSAMGSQLGIEIPSVAPRSTNVNVQSSANFSPKGNRKEFKDSLFEKNLHSEAEEQKLLFIIYN